MTTTHTIKLTTPACFHCGKKSELEVSASGYSAWKSGALIQDAFPALGNDERELIKSGIHPACWNEMFGGFDE